MSAHVDYTGEPFFLTLQSNNKKGRRLKFPKKNNKHSKAIVLIQKMKSKENLFFWHFDELKKKGKNIESRYSIC